MFLFLEACISNTEQQTPDLRRLKHVNSCILSSVSIKLSATVVFPLKKGLYRNCLLFNCCLHKVDQPADSKPDSDVAFLQHFPPEVVVKLNQNRLESKKSGMINV